MEYKMTPAMKQLLDIKSQYPDCIIFFRIGDFYETFGDDAMITSKVTGMVLTKRDKSENAPPLCGAPYHSVDRYLKMMIDAGYKVAIVEQVEDASASKGLVKREVVKVVTLGTFEEGGINALNENKYILSAVERSSECAIAYCDIYTGECRATVFTNKDDMIAEIYKIQPKEILIKSNEYIYNRLKDSLKSNINVLHIVQKENIILEYFNVNDIKILGLEYDNSITDAVANLLYYVVYTNKQNLKNIKNINIYDVYDRMVLDESTINNLNILYGQDGKKEGSLLSVIDHTLSAMGKRKIKNEIVRPLLSIDEITKRHNLIAKLMNNPIIYYQIREYLADMYDIDRIISKVARGNAMYLDIKALSDTIKIYYKLKNTIDNL